MITNNFRIQPDFKENFVNLLNNKQLGFTLVELMVSMVLGLILTAGVLGLYLSSQTNSMVQQQISDFQEDQHQVAQFISDGVAKAGFFNGCSPQNMGLVNLVNTGTSGSTRSFELDFTAGIKGYNQLMLPEDLSTGTGGLYSSTDFKAGSDILQITYIDNDTKTPVIGSNYSGAVDSYVSLTAGFNPNTVFRKGDLATIIEQDCSYATSFVNVSAQGKPYFTKGDVTTQYGGQNNCAVVNRTLGMGYMVKGNYDCGTVLTDDNFATVVASDFLLNQFNQNSSYFTTYKKIYAVMPYENTGSLYEIDLVTDLKTELVRGVEGIQFYYGISSKSSIYQGDASTDGNFERVAGYLSATDFQAAIDKAGSTATWADVVSIKMDLQLEALNSVGNFAPAGRVFTHIINLRNQSN
jgi:prepilin-type N-terminal cleavage/methylation domain-containing protein